MRLTTSTSLWVGALVSIGVHALSLAAFSRVGPAHAATTETELLLLPPDEGAEPLVPPPAAPEKAAAPKPEPPPPPPPPPLPEEQPKVKLGVEESDALTDAWVGFAEATAHAAPFSRVEQSSLSPEPGMPHEGEAPGAPGAPGQGVFRGNPGQPAAEPVEPSPAQAAAAPSTTASAPEAQTDPSADAKAPSPTPRGEANGSKPSRPTDTTSDLDSRGTSPAPLAPPPALVPPLATEAPVAVGVLPETTGVPSNATRLPVNPSETPSPPSKLPEPTPLAPTLDPVTPSPLPVEPPPATEAPAEKPAPDVPAPDERALEPATPEATSEHHEVAPPADKPVDRPDPVQEITFGEAENAEWAEAPIDSAFAIVMDSPDRMPPDPPSPADAERSDDVAEAAPDEAAGGGDSGAQPPTNPATNPSAPPSPKPAAAQPSPNSAAETSLAPTSPGDNGGGGGGRVLADQPAELSEAESDASSLKEALVVAPGKVLAAKGMQVTTVRPRWSITTLATTLPKNPTLRVTFGRTGKVVRADFLAGQTTGSENVDGPLLNAVYRWTAKGGDLAKIPPDQPGAGVTIIVRLLLRGE